MSARTDNTSRRKPDWAGHERIIRQLYVEESKSLKDVMRLMSDQFDFRPTKSQYETQFKKWKIEKNHRSREWSAISRIVLQRKAQGKSSNVCFNGRRIPDTTLDKQLSLYRLEARDPARSHQETSSSELPAGFSILSPQQADDNPPVRYTELPILEFISSFENRFFRSPRRTDRGYLNYSSQHAQDGVVAPIEHAAPMHYEQSTYQRLTVQHKEIIEPLLESLFPSTMLRTSTESPHSPQQSVKRLDTTSLSSAYARLLIFGISNNFAGLDGLSHADIWKFLRDKSNTQFLLFLHSFPNHTSRSLAEKLFDCAIKAEDSDGVDRLLQDHQLGIDINAIVVTCHGELYTALEYSCLKRDVSTAKVLLRHGADPERTTGWDGIDPRKLSVEYRRGALYQALYFAPDLTRQESETELIQLLLNAGAEISEGLGRYVASSENTIVRALLINSTPPEMLLKWYYNNVFHASLPYFEHELAVTVVNALLGACGYQIPPSGTNPGSVESRPSEMPAESRDIIRDLLFLVVQTDNAALAQYLADLHPSIPTERAIICAMESGRISIAELLITKGADDTGSSAFRKTALSMAIGNRYHVLVDMLVDHGALLSIEKENQYYPVLEAAISVGDQQWFQRLTEMTIEHHSGRLGSCLCQAIQFNQHEMALRLIDMGADIDNGAGDGRPPLRLALEGRNRQITQVLLDAGACVCYEEFHVTKSMTGVSVVQAAVIWGDMSILQQLIQAGADVRLKTSHEFFPTPLCIAVDRGNIEVARLLVDSGADVNLAYTNYLGDPMPQPLSIAVTQGDLNMIQFLLSRGADPTESVFLSAISEDNGAILDSLLKAFSQKYRSGVGDGSSKLLCGAIEQGNVELTELLLKHKVGRIWGWNERQISWKNDDEISHCWEQPIATAIAAQTSQIFQLIRFFLEEGSDINSIVRRPVGPGRRVYNPVRLAGLYTETPLLVAVRTKSLSTVKFILQCGAEVNPTHCQGASRTPLQKAAEMGAIDIVRHLVNVGAAVNAPPAPNKGATALQLAAIKGFVGIAAFLVENGADVDAVGAKVGGRTALEGAAENGRLDMVKLLLDAGVWTNGLARQQLDRAIEMASKNGHLVVVELLNSHGN